MIVTVTAYKRPELLSRCLEFIVTADVSPVSHVCISCDWHSNEMYDRMFVACHNILPRNFPFTITKHDKRLGVANHPRWVFNRNYTDDAICALEEDTIVSPDCFTFADWALRQPGYQFVNLAPGPNFSHQPKIFGGLHDNDFEFVHEDWELRSPYGWAFTPAFWRELEPQWNGKIREPYGWDWQLSHLCYREGYRCLTPEVARVYNTGRENGTYDTPGNWDATQRDVVLCQAAPCSIQYKLITHQRPEPENWPEWVKFEVRP